MFIGDLPQRHRGSTVANDSVPAPIGNSLDKMGKKYEADRDKVFAAHVCGKFPRENNLNKE
jgi:hypothetical protein